MTPDEKHMLEEMAELAKENNKILRSMQRAIWWGRFFGFLKWTVIIGLTLGSFYYIQPYLAAILKIYGNLGGSVPNTNDLEQALRALGSDKIQVLLKNISP